MAAPRQIQQSAKAETSAPAYTKSLNELKSFYEKQTKLCQTLTNNNILTEAEYRNAFPEFKRLIDIPRKKGEPIYIMPEFITGKKLHPRLQILADAINKGLPYSKFITASMGETWPLLLRLYLGLQSGFKISADQFHSMLKICYWRDLKQKVTNIPLFESVDLSEAGDVFVRSELYFPDRSEKLQNIFLKKMSNSNIPAAEKYLQVIQLDVNYFRLARYSLENSGEGSESGAVQSSLMAMSVYDMLLFNSQHGPYDIKKVNQFHETGNVKMFAALINISIGFYKIVFLNNQPCLILPSQTMLKAYLDTVNPGRNLKIVRLLGSYGPDIFEKCCDANERPVNLYAPGIQNPLQQHRKIVTPALGVEHDDYHVLFEGTITPKVYQQLTHAKQVLRKILGSATEFTSEILRLCDREQGNEASEDSRFIALLVYVFAKHITGTIDPKLTCLSSIIILTDMLLSPNMWPSFKDVKPQAINLFLPAETANNELFQTILLETANIYGKRTNNNVAFVAILLLCHYHLKDVSLCKILLKQQIAQPDTALYAWRKQSHGHLYPVLILNGEDYDFNKLGTISPQARALLWLDAKFPTPTPTLKLEEKTLPTVSNITVQIPDFTDAKLKIITENKGKVINAPNVEKVATIEIDTTILKKPLRDALGIGRLLLQGKERAQYLAFQGMTIEFISNTDKFHVTFMESQRQNVEKVAKQWHLIKKDISSQERKLTP